MSTRLYYVDVIPRHAACTDSGHTFDIRALTRASAISQARQLIRAAMHYDRHDGPLIYTARLA